MTTLLSLFCSEPILSACARRNTFSSDCDYLLVSNSWDLNSDGSTIIKGTSEGSASASKHRSSSEIEPRRRPARLRRLFRFVSTLNPLRLSRESGETTENVNRTLPYRTVSFATTSSTTSYSRLIPSHNLSQEDDEDENQDFAIVHIQPGRQPLFISDARRCDRSRWLSGNAAQSFDATLRRRHSLVSEARINRRAFSMSRMAEWDASVRRAQYSRRRPESAAFDESCWIRQSRPKFYNSDDEADENHIPPLPPKAWKQQDGNLNMRTYVNVYEPFAPPRRPLKKSLQLT
ncbi:hypothetical protein M3Y94_00291500 [Aphelenchoides besseyi]|nr:hypothetical protein M3Y94_00291500 [Aphelenchoides besseyi]KAI6235898.1 hypothetical protein M3Y95_00100200 [Aphelenchoides besseyi]